MTNGPLDVTRESGPPGRQVYRRAARLVLVDETDEHVLLVRGFDPAVPHVAYWFTIGGGVHPGEDPRRAAAREAFEEAGVVVDPDALVGPFQPERVVFGFDGATVHQDQEFYLARVERVEPDTTGLDELEVRSTMSVSWVRLDALAGLTEAVYPTTMLQLVARLRAVQPPRPRV
ncbi:MAG: NUDIX domain-containing protein [Dermatophilaceae bacterium]